MIYWNWLAENLMRTCCGRYLNCVMKMIYRIYLMLQMWVITWFPRYMSSINLLFFSETSVCSEVILSFDGLSGHQCCTEQQQRCSYIRGYEWFWSWKKIKSTGRFLFFLKKKRNLSLDGHSRISCFHGKHRKIRWMQNLMIHQ